MTHILIDILLVAAGLTMLLGGAYGLVLGASSLALRLGIPELVIGLTVAAMGTSAPELIVAVTAALKSSADMAVGSVVGSNLANILLILGASALISPLVLQKTLRWREIPFTLLSTLVLAVLANDVLLSGDSASLLDRGDGLALLGYFAVYLYYLFSVAQRKDAETLATSRAVSVPAALLLALAGIAGLALGGRWLVDGAAAIAASLGMSQALIGLTVLAVGTSLPELATSVTAALRGNADLAVGNVVGSNIFNILWILGLTSTIAPLRFNRELNVDIWLLVGVTVLFFLFTFTGGRQRIDRCEGGLFLGIYAGYLAFLVLRG
jgi:cation:H+ antiporter